MPPGLGAHGALGRLARLAAVALATAGSLVAGGPAWAGAEAPAATPDAWAPVPGVDALPPALAAAFAPADPFALQLADAAGALGLAEAEEMTLRLLPAVRAAEAGVGIARAKARLALAAWMPQLSGVGGYSRQTANFALRPGSLPQSLSGSSARAVSSRSKSYNYWNFGLSLSQMVYDFGATASSLKAARQAVDAGRHALANASQAGLLATRLAYFDAAAKQAQVDVAEATLANMRRHLHQIDQQVRVGQRAPIELASAQTDVANAEVQRIGAQNAWDASRAALRQAMGVEGLADDFVLRGDVMPKLAAEDAALEALLRRALAARPDYLGQRAVVLQAEAARGATLSGLLPTLSASAGVTEAGEQIDRMGWNWNVGATLSWSLNNGGQNLALLRQAQATLAQARAQTDAMRQALRAELETSRLAVAASVASCRATAVAEAQARVQLHLAEGRYARGLGNVIELSDAQLATSSATAARINAVYGLAQSRARLARSLGGEVTP